MFLVALVFLYLLQHLIAQSTVHWKTLVSQLQQDNNLSNRIVSSVQDDARDVRDQVKPTNYVETGGLVGQTVLRMMSLGSVATLVCLRFRRIRGDSFNASKG
jgi:hypothetical protein